MSERAPVDRERIDAVCRGDDSLAIELIGMLVDEAGPMLVALDEHVQCYNVTQAHELAHALKGIAGNVGAFDLRDAALRLESVSGMKQTPASHTLDVEMTAVSQAFERVRIIQRTWQSRAARKAGIFSQ